MKYLTREQVMKLHQVLIETSGGSLGIRDEGMLDSALKTPLQTFDKRELFPTILDKATRLAFGLIKNHPFIDGNKRIGTHAMLIFLALNNIMLSYKDEELIDIIFKVASDRADENDLYNWIENHQA
ncbi:type II toxin-antitoxin system death-on-curing family toxin [Fannyhessea vaginae]|uniref:type II toxin-antitoxin system death-on-curing family toxin n=1 Tax=Fannyhessea vaginae TaxID=82135 RepID=UPI00076FB15B|nr:type II toxin-antitoxin system death-on-curing family toxin [Fannyhessea vaginae]KXG90887.1 death-on-curing family protein [Fannyhessea vaginae]